MFGSDPRRPTTPAWLVEFVSIASVSFTAIVGDVCRIVVGITIPCQHTIILLCSALGRTREFVLRSADDVVHAPVQNAVDDALMGITHVVRAEEHLTNSLRQCLILDALEFPRPQYAHCSLILGEDRSKLSKRHGATSVDQFRREVMIFWR